MKIRLITDSTADLAPEVAERVTVVPLTIHFGEEEYIDGITMNHKQFYEKLIESDVLPTTSQATPVAFSDVFDTAAKNGEDVIVITISSKLSGTYQSAVIASQDYSGNIYVIDSKTAAIGHGILVERALQLIDSGMTAAEVAERITEECEKVRVIALLDTLEYLKRGGRISKTVAFAGGLLSLKPVVAINDGEIVMLGKARGSKQGNNLLVSEIESSGGVDFEKPLLLGYTGLSDAMLQKYIQDSEALWCGNGDKIRTACVGGVIGTHAGPGVVAAAFFKKG